jgi:hypothetical protein
MSSAKTPTDTPRRNVLQTICYSLGQSNWHIKINQHTHMHTPKTGEIGVDFVNFNFLTKNI